MRIYENDNNLIIEDAKDFSLFGTFECGQCFRWNRKDSGYSGVAGGRVLEIFKEDEKIILKNTSKKDWDEFWCDYFDFNRDYSAVKKELSKDKVLKEAIEFGDGIRILNQEPFECLISFIISASNNIPRIKKIIEALCESFGEPIACGERLYYSFPKAERIAGLSLDELSVIKAGFRDKYILGAAKMVAGGMIDLESLKRASYDYARSELLKIPGVGEKVAGCILLFSLGKTSSFPVDVWVKRIMEYCYFDLPQTRENISEFAKDRFGDLGGFAQQYLFFWARENKIGI